MKIHTCTQFSIIFWKVLRLQFRCVLERREGFPCGQHKEKKEAGCRDGAGISEYLTPQSHFHTQEKQIQTEQLLTML